MEEQNALVSNVDAALLERAAGKVGTPFWIMDARVLRRRLDLVAAMAKSSGVQPRYAMKALPVTRVLREMRARGIWIDAVSGNECLRAVRAGYGGGSEPPEILFTADVFRDNALDVVREQRLLPNIGSPGMLLDLAQAQYTGPISVRLNPGFGHGHVNACDTGGPSSKHGIWAGKSLDLAAEAQRAGMETVMLHAHIGSGPAFSELLKNLDRLAGEFCQLLPKLPQVRAISMGGGIPHNYRNRNEPVDLEALGSMLKSARERLCQAAGRELRVEIEPGRFFVAPAVTLVARVADVKRTETNEKGKGNLFVMVDAGFNDLVRPAMYGAYHEITIAGKNGFAKEDVVVAGPLCESGDVFTRDDGELLVPRRLPPVERGDLLCLHDAGAYGYAMSSNYNSIGRAPQVWIEEDGSLELISRRETVDDLLRIETSEKL